MTLETIKMFFPVNIAVKGCLVFVWVGGRFGTGASRIQRVKKRGAIISHRRRKSPKFFKNLVEFFLFRKESQVNKVFF
jgi:hypothetical protein